MADRSDSDASFDGFLDEEIDMTAGERPHSADLDNSVASSLDHSQMSDQSSVLSEDRLSDWDSGGEDSEQESDQADQDSGEEEDEEFSSDLDEDITTEPFRQWSGF